MSDYLAVGAVTAVLKSLLNAGLTDGGPATVLASPPGVTNVPPDFITTGNTEQPQLNLFMYYASINPALRNLNLPSVDFERRDAFQSAAGDQSALSGQRLRLAAL